MGYPNRTSTTNTVKEEYHGTLGLPGLPADLCADRGRFPGADYRRLEAEGWIATVPGKGCFVCGDGEIREREKKRLLLSFDEAAAALLTMGASHGELVARIEKGDHRHA